MKYLAKTSCAAILCSILLPPVCRAQSESQQELAGDVNAGKSLLATESPDAVAKRLAWWTDARFGMFIHWGLYSQTGCRWQGQNGKSAHMMYYLKIPLAQYTTLAGQFNPVKFNADQWAGLAKEAGMKYMVITAKHHEGFAMYDSKSSAYSITALSPWKHDPLKELREACGRAGIKFGIYYSLGRDWEDPDAVGNSAHYKENTWDFPDTKSKVFAKYFERKVKPQVRELMAQYHPAIMWFDTPGSISRGESRELLDMIRKLDPNCIVNARIGNRLGDYAVQEQKIPDAPSPQPWETCMTINGHLEYYIGDEKWKSPKTCIENLIRIVSMNGNYLLDVGPTDQGLMPQGGANVLRQMGAWLKVNGESLYGTRPSPLDKPAWGCCTQKKTAEGTTLYLHVFNWPADGKLTVRGVSQPVASASLLAGGKSLQVAPGEGSVTLQVPMAAPDPISTTVVLKLKGAAGPKPGRS